MYKTLLEAKKRGTKISLAITIVVLLAFLLPRQYQESSRSDTEKALALEQCNTQELDYCEWLDSRHEKCFGYNYDHGDRFTDPSFNRQGYTKCLTIGPQAWLQERFEKTREEHRKKQATIREITGTP